MENSFSGRVMGRMFDRSNYQPILYPFNSHFRKPKHTMNGNRRGECEHCQLPLFDFIPIKH